MIAESITLSEDHRYSDAIALLDRQTTTWASRQNELNRVRGDINNAWDSWAYLQAQKPMRIFQEHLQAHDLKNAYTTLQGIGMQLRSAKVQKDIDQFQRQWEEAMLADEVQNASTQLEEELVRELWPQEYLNHLGHDLLVMFNYKPKSNAALHENTVRFTGSGQATTAEHPKILDGRSMRCMLRFIDKDHEGDHWDMYFSGGRKLIITRDGMKVTGTGGEDVELAKGAAQTIFSIRNDRKSVEIQINDSGGWVPIAPATELINYSWEIAGKRAIDLRVRVVPLRQANKNSGKK
jgi:hypothetical protein